MSVDVAPAVPGHGHHEDLAHQFEQIDQQNESYIVGMWTFLVTEIMFFRRPIPMLYAVPQQDPGCVLRDFAPPSQCLDGRHQHRAAADEQLHDGDGGLFGAAEGSQ